MEKYILVEWPESQEFIGNPECYPVIAMDWNADIHDQGYFVPEKVYNQFINNKN